MVLQFFRESWNDKHEELPVLFIIHWQNAVQLHGEIPARIHELSPQFAAFPPAVISSIGAEHQEHGNGETQQGMQQRKVFYIIALAQLQVIHFQPGDAPGI